MTTAPPTFADLLGRAIDERGLSLGRLRYHLRRRGHDLSVATLSYWRRGVSRPTRGASLAAVGALEEILEVPPGVLTGALVERLHPDSFGDTGLADLAASLGLSWDDGLTRTSLTDLVSVDDQGSQVRQRIRESMVAQRSGVIAYPVATWSDDPDAEAVIEASGNCLLGREVRLGSTVVAEIRLPFALDVGQRWMTDLEMTGRTPVGETGSWGRRITTPVRTLHYTVMFSEAKVPLRAEVVIDAKGMRSSYPLVVRGSVLELHLEDFGPGKVDLNWYW